MKLKALEMKWKCRLPKNPSLTSSFIGSLRFKKVYHIKWGSHVTAAVTFPTICNQPLMVLRGIHQLAFQNSAERIKIRIDIKGGKLHGKVMAKIIRLSLFHSSTNSSLIDFWKAIWCSTACTSCVINLYSFLVPYTRLAMIEREQSDVV